MFYSVVAAIAFSASVFLYICNCLKLQSMGKGRLFDRVYYRKSQLVEAQVESIGFAEGNYQISCNVPGEEQAVEITASESVVRRIQRTNTLNLICYEIPKGRLYTIAAITELPASIQVSEVTPVNAEYSQMLDEKAEMLHKINIGTIVLSFLSCLASPFASMLLSASSILLALFVVPLKKWTTRQDFGIIKGTEESSGQRKVSPNAELPVGYADWSDTNKEIYAIRQRLQNSLKTPIPESTEETAVSPDESAESAGPVPDEPHEPAEKTEAPQKVCTRCGCLVDASARFCPSCGHPLSEETSELPIPEPKTEDKPTEPTADGSVEPIQEETKEISEPTADAGEKVATKPAVEEQEWNPDSTEEKSQAEKEKPAQEKRATQRGPSKQRRKPRVNPDDEVAAMVESIAGDFDF